MAGLLTYNLRAVVAVAVPGSLVVAVQHGTFLFGPMALPSLLLLGSQGQVLPKLEAVVVEALPLCIVATP